MKSLNVYVCITDFTSALVCTRENINLHLVYERIFFFFFFFFFGGGEGRGGLRPLKIIAFILSGGNRKVV